MSPRLRCAIYTRKSSEEGLEQDFNSLHAQREACEAYIKSQIGEGWSALATAYDDGGFSGGSLERPGLQRLLVDIAAGRVDVVVVYKVDRLTRSLADFAKIVDAFDARGVSFVSVTQAFNTTTSMGRLTLNVLLSFAQFEREVTSERIRDKIAASKAKGMWMGGVVPLGYDLDGRTLKVNEPEADVVRRIFNRYLELGSARDLALELAQAGVRSKAWTTRAGRQMGGAIISRGSVLHILQSRLYLGEIVHKGRTYPGQHPALVSQDLFAEVAAKISTNVIQRHARAGRAGSSVLTGILFDAMGQPMSPSFGYGRKGRAYRYYIARALQVGALSAPAPGTIRRVAADAVEELLLETLRRLLADEALHKDALREVLRRVELRAEDTHLVVIIPATAPDSHPKFYQSVLQTRLRPGEQVILEAGEPPAIRVVLPQRLQLRGGRARIVGGQAPQGRIDKGMVNALRRAHADLAELSASPLTPKELQSHATAPATQYERQLSRLAFLAPDLQGQILSGTQPPGLTLRALLKAEMPLAWADQRRWFKALASK
jgi:DNA invertase Pin-like site-specific DNA recombinase